MIHYSGFTKKNLRTHTSVFLKYVQKTSITIFPWNVNLSDQNEFEKNRIQDDDPYGDGDQSPVYGIEAKILNSRWGEWVNQQMINFWLN